MRNKNAIKTHTYHHHKNNTAWLQSSLDEGIGSTRVQAAYSCSRDAQVQGTRQQSDPLFPWGMGVSNRHLTTRKADMLTIAALETALAKCHALDLLETGLQLQWGSGECACMHGEKKRSLTGSVDRVCARVK